MAIDADTIIEVKTVERNDEGDIVGVNLPITFTFAEFAAWLGGEIDFPTPPPPEVSAADITDSTPIGQQVMTASDAGAARTAIGAGTSSLEIGTTGTTAKAGDYAPSEGTQALLDAGTDTTQRTWTAADIAAYVASQIPEGG